MLPLADEAKRAEEYSDRYGLRGRLSPRPVQLSYAVRASAAGKATTGPNAARSQDFLYGEDGLPG